MLGRLEVGRQAVGSGRSSCVCVGGLATTFSTRSHSAIFDLSPGQDKATKWLPNLSPKSILGAFCTICRACTVGTGLGAKFGRKMIEKG